MKMVKSYPLKTKYTRANSLAVLDLDDLPFPEGFVVQESSAVLLPNGEFAGNHKHPRQEAYFCPNVGVELHWLDEAGNKHVEPMAAKSNNPRLFVIPPSLSHAVVNKSGKDAMLLGYADGPLENAEPVAVAMLDSTNDVEVSEQESSHIAKMLSKLEPGFLPPAIFHQVTRLAVMPIIEVVPLRRLSSGKVEVLLLKRDADDPVWPGQLHVPGTVVRASDAPGSFHDALQRISQELANAKTSQPVFVKNILHHSGRGIEASQVFWVEVYDNPPTGEFYDADNLPKSFVNSQLDFVPDAVAHFKNANA